MAAGGNLEATLKFEDVIIYLSKNEWKLLEKWQKDLYCEVLADNFDALVFTGHPVTKVDILAWLERCEHLDAKGTHQPRARDSSGTLCATSGRVAQMCRNEPVEPVRSLETIRETAKEDVAQYGDVGETEPLNLSAGKQENPIKEDPFPHAEYQKDGRVLAGSTHSQRTVTAPTQHKCGECGKRFRLKALLLIHQKISATKESFPCPKCGLCFPSPSHQRTHLQACPKRGKASLQENWLSRRPGDQALERWPCCADCGGSFPRYLDLLQHQKSHDEAKPWPCSQCGAVFMYRSDLALHEESHHEEALPERTACGKNCLCEASLLLHFASRCERSVATGGPEPRGHEPLLPAAYSKEEKPYLCAQCGLLFRLEVNLEVHYRYCLKEWPLKRGLNGSPQLPKRGAPNVAKKLHKCQGCGEKFVYKRQLVAHLKGHVKEGRYLCTYCGKRFGCRSGLGEHQQSRREGAACKNGTSLEDSGAVAANRRTRETKPLRRRERGKSFAKGYLHVRQALHMGVRYTCLVCGKVSNFKNAAIAHSKSHRDKGDFSKCPELKELSGSGPRCCTTEKSQPAPASQPHGQEGMCQPSEGFPPTCAEGISPQSRHHLQENVSGGEQSAQAELRKQPRWQAKHKPASWHSLPRPFKCIDCGKDFAYFSRLIMHRRRHTGDFPVQCGECGKGFVHKRYLNLHWKIHAKEGV